MKTLNSYYVEAEKIGGQSYLEGCLACATAYIIFLCMETRYETVIKLCTATQDCQATPVDQNYSNMLMCLLVER